MSRSATADVSGPLFRALATTTRPIYQLLRCISFANKVQVEISEDGIKFLADHARVMQGMASLSKTLFASYTLYPPTTTRTTRNTDGDSDEDEDENHDEPMPATFQISLPALLGAIQIFGIEGGSGGGGGLGGGRQVKPDPDAYRGGGMRSRSTPGPTAEAANSSTGMMGGGGGSNDAFSHQMLGMPGTCCCLTYPEEGAPFGIVLEEASVKTTCNLATYVPEAVEPIPFDRDNLQFKIIMQPRWLLDALIEIAPATPHLLTIAVSSKEPYLRLSSHGPLGSSSVDFSRGRGLFESIWLHPAADGPGDGIDDDGHDDHNDHDDHEDIEAGSRSARHKRQRRPRRWVQSFKFDMIKSATEAMRIASKVSIRGDEQGVLNLQFMVEMGDHGGAGGGGNMQWLHFTFVPYISDEEEDEDEEEGDEEDEEDEEDD